MKTINSLVRTQHKEISTGEKNVFWFLSRHAILLKPSHILLWIAVDIFHMLSADARHHHSPRHTVQVEGLHVLQGERLERDACLPSAKKRPFRAPSPSGG